MLAKIDLNEYRNKRRKDFYKNIVGLLLVAILVYVGVKIIFEGAVKQEALERMKMCQFTEGQTQGMGAEYYLNNCTK